jgi:hypothetical protein
MWNLELGGLTMLTSEFVVGITHDGEVYWLSRAEVVSDAGGQATLAAAGDMKVGGSPVRRSTPSPVVK